MLTSNSSIIALDIGERRIGVAAANAAARIPHPVTTILNDQAMVAALQTILKERDAAALVVGLPRGLNGQHTDQTRTVETFVTTLKQHITLPIYWQDEALTSHKAEAELNARQKAYTKDDVDALAATYILDDFLGEHPEIKA
jgi:putative Holliday junction resolvase